jgi:hypothetical protein
VAEPVEAWWERRRRSKNTPVPYPIGSYRAEWERYPVLIRQYHPDLNHGITLTQIPPAAEVYLQWQCEAGHIFVATPAEQRGRPGTQRRRSVWCPDCAELANPSRVRPRREPGADAARTPAARRGLRRSTNGSRPAEEARIPNESRPDEAGLPGEALHSTLAPKPASASAAEGDLRHRLRTRFDLDLTPNAIAVSRPFFGRFEVWPDIVLPELRVAIEYDTVGRHGLEHVGPREKADRQKDRALRAVRWEVIRIRCGKLRPLGPYDLTASGVTAKLIDRLDDTLCRIRGELIVAAYRRRD